MCMPEEWCTQHRCSFDFHLDLSGNQEKSIFATKTRDERRDELQTKNNANHYATPPPGGADGAGLLKICTCEPILGDMSDPDHPKAFLGCHSIKRPAGRCRGQRRAVRGGEPSEDHRGGREPHEHQTDRPQTADRANKQQQAERMWIKSMDRMTPQCLGVRRVSGGRMPRGGGKQAVGVTEIHGSIGFEPEVARDGLRTKRIHDGGRRRDVLLSRSQTCKSNKGKKWSGTGCGKHCKPQTV